jgi:hypothetical protein
MDGLLDAYNERIGLTTRPLAMNEVVFHGKLDGQPAQLYLMANSRILEAVVGGKSYFFRPGRDPAALDPASRVGQNPGLAIWTAIREAMREPTL